MSRGSEIGLVVGGRPGVLLSSLGVLLSSGARLMAPLAAVNTTLPSWMLDFSLSKSTDIVSAMPSVISKFRANISPVPDVSGRGDASEVLRIPWSIFEIGLLQDCVSSPSDTAFDKGFS